MEKPKDFIPDIFIACKKGKLPSVQWLIEKQNVDINIKDGHEQTPLHKACVSNQLPIVEYLISKGANVNSRTIFGDYSIHYVNRKTKC